MEVSSQLTDGITIYKVSILEDSTGAVTEKQIMDEAGEKEANVTVTDSDGLKVTVEVMDSHTREYS